MRCPTLADLPPPPHDRFGWPWTEECPQLPELRPDGSPWPRISIVTPSYNQGQFIEETIRSILLQGYPDIEYIIADGGSRDDSVSIIKKYEPWLSSWISERDRGQSDAINKGLNRTSGAVWAFINSDDWLSKNALSIVGLVYTEGRILATSVLIEDAGSRRVERNENINLRDITLKDTYGSRFTRLFALGHWMPTDRVKRIGGYDSSFNYFFDFELLLRYLRNHPYTIDYIQFPTVHYRAHENTKTVLQWHRFERELIQILSQERSREKDPYIKAKLTIIILTKRWAYMNSRLMENVVERIRISNSSSDNDFIKMLRCLVIGFQYCFVRGAWRFAMGSLLRIGRTAFEKR